MDRAFKINIFLLFVGISLYFMSGNLVHQIESAMGHSENNRALLMSNLQLQRGLALMSIALAVEDKALIDQSREVLKASYENLERGITLNPKAFLELKKELLNIEEDFEDLKSKQQGDQNISKNDLLDLSSKIELLGQQFSENEIVEWEGNLQKYEKIIARYKFINYTMLSLYLLLLFTTTLLIRSLRSQQTIEDKIEESNHLHGLLFSSLSESVFMCDRTGLIKACNNSASMLLQLDVRKIIGSNIESFFPVCYLNESNYVPKENLLLDIVSKGRSLNDVLLVTGDGDKARWFSLNSQPIAEKRSDDGFSVILSLHDVTKKMKTKKIVKDQQLKLLESSKLQIIGEMAGGIAHEVNNPLTVISIVAGKLNLKAKSSEHLEGEQVSKDTSKILNTVNRIAKIIKSMLSMARGNDENFDSVPVMELINMSLEFCHAFVVKRQIKFSFSEDNTDIIIECSATQISQVILNLIKNAADAIEGKEQKWIHLEVVDDHDFVLIKVTDSGEGIPLDIQKKILMPFFTTKPIGKGTGIGLTISRSIVERHQGELYIDSQSPNTCFVIKLPKVQAPKKDSQGLEDEVYKQVS